jgi:hypothetical protein
MFCILVLIARFGDDRQRNCKTAAGAARDIQQVAAKSTHQRTRNIQAASRRFRTGLKWLE